MTGTPGTRSTDTRLSPLAGRSPARRRRRPMVTAPDGGEANHAILAHLAEHRVSWRP
ncbi:hypothetical protein [Streptomyces sp. NPDC048665]|uniref:hypothetical protein n=1 Tax=Streptomyces sp. NPDC048665 TaxID=3155490 RepID=UPI00343AE823